MNWDKSIADPKCQECDRCYIWYDPLTKKYEPRCMNGLTPEECKKES